MPTQADSRADGPLVLSVIVPVHNKRYLIAELLRRVAAVSVTDVSETEIVVVDDASDDGTAAVLDHVLASGEPRVRVLRHEAEEGIGAALRTGIAAARGDLILFQDPGLEYDPRDYPRLIRPFLEDGADAVYGSRLMAGERRRVLSFRHSLGHRLLTLLSNGFTDLDLTDVGTACKAFRAPLLKSIPLRTTDSAVDLELAAKIAKRQFRVFEVPVSYLGRPDQERERLRLTRAFKALATVLYFWLKDDVYAEDEYGSHILHSLERTRRFNRWMAETVARHAGQGARVLEIGAGIGNMTSHLLPRELYVASDVNPNYLHYLRNLAYGKPYLEVAHVDLEDDETFEPWRGRFDTVVCLNVLEHVSDPVAALRRMKGCLEPGGRLILYVPQGQWLYSSLDEVLGHRCRYSRQGLVEELDAVGLELVEFEEFNRCSVPGWWWNGKLLKKRTFSRVQLKIFDLLNPLLRRIDRLFPWPGLGIVATARRR